MKDLEALALVTTEAPLLSPAESQFLRTVARHESFYADGWKSNADIPGAVGDPRTSNNWGAITAKNPPFFTYLDGLGVKEPRQFKVYASDGPAIRDLSRELFIRRPAIIEKLKEGDGAGAVAVMKATRYFQAPLESYIEAARRNYESLLKGTSEPRLLRFNAAQSSGTPSIDPILGMILTLGAMWTMHKWL